MVLTLVILLDFNGRQAKLKKIANDTIGEDIDDFIKEKIKENTASQNIGKTLEHKFIKGLYNMVSNNTENPRNLYINPIMKANGDISAGKIEKWDQLEEKAKDKGALLALGETPDIRSRSKEIWKLFLGRGNNIMKTENSQYNFVLNYIPLPTTEEIIHIERLITHRR